MATQDTTPVIVGAARTPIGRFLGALSPLRAPQLGAIAIRAALERAGAEATAVEEVVFGQVVQGGSGQAPARQAAIGAGLPPTVPAVTLNKVCGSGLEAVVRVAQAIRAGDVQLAVAGGQESMSNVPYYLRGLRTGVKFGDQTLEDGLIHDGLWCAFCDVHMGGHAEYTARKAGITRAMQDEYALRSHQKAVAAQDAGKFDAEIVPIEVPGRQGPVRIDRDEGPRRDTSLDALARLKPAFAKDAPAGIPPEELTVTAGNASPMNDGAAAVVVASEAFARAHGLPILGRIVGYAVGATEPQELFFAPIAAVRRLLEKTGRSIHDFDLIEVNEAFAAQVLADGQALGWDWERVNVHGGAIALGHPIGASGARILVTLLYAMQDRGARLGLATLCLGGGEAVAVAVERV